MSFFIKAAAQFGRRMGTEASGSSASKATGTCEAILVFTETFVATFGLLYGAFWVTYGVGKTADLFMEGLCRRVIKQELTQAMERQDAKIARLTQALTKTDE